MNINEHLFILQKKNTDEVFLLPIIYITSSTLKSCALWMIKQQFTEEYDTAA